MPDPHNLQRFVAAQSPIYSTVLSELRAGQKKRTHWMWFIFPQLAGLGHSQMAQTHAISSRDEAIAYLAHPVLGARLRECTALVNVIEGKTIDQIFGYPDDLKFQSCMTLFSAVASEQQVWQDALEKYFGGGQDRTTLDLLQ